MKNLFFFVFLFISLSSTRIKAQHVCFSSPFTVTNSAIDYLGNQTQTVDVQVHNTSNYTIEYRIKGFSGQILQTGTGTISPGQIQDNTFDILQTSTINYAEVYIEIVSAPSGYDNGTCSDVVRFNVPPVPVCLEILSSQEINCIVDNDGIGIDGDIHVFEMQVHNNDIAPLEFGLIANQELLVEYHPQEYILSGETKIVTYNIRSDSGAPTSGEISFTFEGQNFSSGCEGPVYLTFQPCEIPVCLEMGYMTHDVCSINNDGSVSHTYIAQVNNTSNLPLQYSIISTDGGSISGATSLTIAANTSENIGFDFITTLADRSFSCYIEVETAGVSNGCEEVIAVSLPDCSIQATTGSISLFAFFDRNHNGSPDLGENGLSGIEFIVRHMTTGSNYIATTNALGLTSVSGLDPGLYLVNQTIDIPWTVTNPPAGALNNVLVNAGGVTTLDFANDHPNAGIAPITIHNLEAVCIEEQSSGSHVYKIYGQLSTSFEDVSNLSVHDFQNQTTSNLAIGSIPGLGSYIPFSFDYSTNLDSVNLSFLLSTQTTAARDTFKVIFPACCGSGGGIVADTLVLCPTISIEYGTNFKTGQNARLGRVHISNIPKCAASLHFKLPQDVVYISEIKPDGTLVPSPLGNTFSLNRHDEIEFFVSSPTVGGIMQVSTVGCVNPCTLNVKVEDNAINQTTFPYAIAQEIPDFSNIYGASFSLKNINDPSHSIKYVSFGLASSNSNALILGATGGKYLSQDEGNEIIFAIV